MKVAFFSAGTVGAGHLMRGIALRRGLARAGFQGDYRVFGPPRPFRVAGEQDGHEAVEIRNDATLHDRNLAQVSRLAEALEGERAKLFGCDGSL